MGRSTSSSCFKILACDAGESDDDGDLDPAASKGPSDKRRWSFRKRSARHQVLSDNVISEPVSFGHNKESPEANTKNFSSPKILSVPEKGPTEEAVVDSGIVEPLVTDRDTATNHSLDDSVAVTIQAAIRGYFARRELRKLRNVVKLQAAVRGHLIRRQAVESLRCVQAIIKMQAVVRARHARRYAKQSAAKDDEKLQIDNERSVNPGNGVCSIRPNKTHSSMEKSLPNRFARQILDSTPKKRHIYIKCDPSRSDSTWKWLERWMVVTSSYGGQQQEQNLVQGCQGLKENTKLSANGVANVAPVASVSISSDSKFDPCEGQIPVLSDGTSQPSLNSVSGKSKSDSNNPKCTTKRASCEPLEKEGNKLVLGSGKPCNLAFAAAQSKFEELSSSTTVVRSINPVLQDAFAESKSDSPQSQVNSSAKTKDLNTTVSSIARDPRVQIETSEFGTEISVSSTPDSFERSEAVGGEIVLEIGAWEKGNYAINGGAKFLNLNAEAKNSLDSEVLKSQKLDEENLVNLITAADALQLEQQPEEPTTSDMQTQIENLVDPQAYRSSPEGTPRSHTTAPESHGTPSSQVSINAKKGKKDNIPTRKQRSQSVSKKSPSNPNTDSDGRSSLEHLHKDSKTASRRNSLGTVKPDHGDHEPRISSSNSLPSYMQATESARAKALAANSPKSSPDVHEKDHYMKKRHSLPIGNGKQGSSPRMLRSASQAQQNSKANGSHSPHDSAERRWQR